MTPDICGQKFKKKRRYGQGGGKPKTPTFWKLMNFGPHILTLFESPRLGLQNARNLWVNDVVQETQ